MDLRDNFIVTSKYGTGSAFTANFAGPIRVQKGHKISLKSIFYGPAYNVSTKNNLLVITLKKKEGPQIYDLFVEPGFYRSLLTLTFAISKTINNWIDEHDELKVEFDFEPAEGADSYMVDRLATKELHHSKVDYDATTDIITFTMENHDHLCMKMDTRPNVLDLLEFEDNSALAGYQVKNGYLTNYSPAFVYGSVIENSYINSQASRLLAVIPLQSGFSNGNKSGHHFYEFSSPTYYNFGISEFSEIMFYILDMNVVLGYYVL